MSTKGLVGRTWSLKRILWSAKAVVATVMIFFLLGCDGKSDSTFPAGPPTSPAASGVNAWAYQLQNVDPALVATNSTFDLVVIDYSADGTAAGEWPPQQISHIRASGKKVLAYLSIGEAEDYRFYWNPSWYTNPPAWLGPENPDWPGNYKVRYWDADWQEIVRIYLDRIVSQGFDGVYLDIVDAYYFWSEENPERPSAEVDMIRFISLLRAYLSKTHQRPGFWIVPQNGEFIIYENDTTPALRTQFLESITAIGVEDVFFRGPLDEDNPFNPDVERLAVLLEYQAHGKPVFSIEYLYDASLIAQYTQEAFERGFYPYTSVRALNILRDGIARLPN